ncbi:MAG TPA: hypothetical protein PKW80_04485, partial [Bacteroidales bacterium]|nr:hypothetical protein [Bacteroidales bacterium]
MILCYKIADRGRRGRKWSFRSDTTYCLAIIEIMNKLRQIFLTITFLNIPVFINEALAQVPPPHPGDENSVPVDGLGLLAALGIAYGINKLRKKKK